MLLPTVVPVPGRLMRRAVVISVTDASDTVGERGTGGNAAFITSASLGTIGSCIGAGPEGSPAGAGPEGSPAGAGLEGSPAGGGPEGRLVGGGPEGRLVCGGPEGRSVWGGEGIRPLSANEFITI